MTQRSTGLKERSIGLFDENGYRAIIVINAMRRASVQERH
jgi:hypothetical protein